MTMREYRVESFKVVKAKTVETDLQSFLNKLAGEGWTIISVLADSIKAKGVGLSHQQADRFLVVAGR